MPYHDNILRRITDNYLQNIRRWLKNTRLESNGNIFSAERTNLLPERERESDKIKKKFYPVGPSNLIPITSLNI